MLPPFHDTSLRAALSKAALRAAPVASLLLALSLGSACGKSEPAPVAPVAPVAENEAATPAPGDAPAQTAEPTADEEATEPAAADEVTGEEAGEPAAADESDESGEEAGEPAAADEDDAMPAGFARYTHEEGRFSVDAPGEPQFTDTTSETALGTLTYTNATFRLPEGALMIAWGDLPIEIDEDDGTIDAMFDGGRDAMLKNINGKLLSEEVITLDGRPGRAWLIEIAGPPEIGLIVNHARSYLDGTRNYILQGMRLAKGDPAQAEHFVSSFRFTAPVAAGEPDPEPAPTAP